MRRGFTLIEMLAVVVILALVASTLAVGLATTAHAADWRSATAEISRFDRLTRLSVRTEGALEVTIDGNTLVARNQSAELFRSGTILVPALGATRTSGDTTSALQLDRQSDHGNGREIVTTVAIDSSGRSIEFAYRLTDGDRVMRVHVAGLTGFIWTEDEL